jgi:hypothetical protein
LESLLTCHKFIFTLPLFFQVVLSETASKAGSRLIIPSLATPVGGFTSGWIMSRWGHMRKLVQIGTFVLTIGNVLVLLLGQANEEWKYLVYIFPSNLGAGLAYPSTLFAFIAAFEHHGKRNCVFQSESLLTYPPTEQAVSTSLVYLIRQLGFVWGISLTSATIQNVLASRLPAALADVPNKDEVIDAIRRSVYALNELSPDIQSAAQTVYYDAIKAAFALSLGMSAIAFFASLFIDNKKLSRSK